MFKEVTFGNQNVLPVIKEFFKSLLKIAVENKDVLEIHIKDYYRITGLDYYVKENNLIVHEKSDVKDSFLIYVNGVCEGNKTEKYVKKVNDLLSAYRTKLYNDYFEETDDNMSVVYKNISESDSQTTYVLRDNKFTSLFYNSGDEKSLDVSIKTTDDNLKLLSLIFNPRSFIKMRKFENLIKKPILVDSPELLTNHAILREDKKGNLIAVAMFNSFPSFLGSANVSKFFNLPLVRKAAYSCLNNKIDVINESAKNNLKFFDYYERVISRNTRMRNLPPVDSLFENNYIKYNICAFSGGLIPELKFFDMISILRITDKFLKDENGNLVYADYYKMKKIVDKYKIKTTEKVGFKTYEYDEKTDAILNSRLIDRSDYLNRFTIINSYGTGNTHNIFLNDDGTSEERTDQLYLGVEMEFDRGGQDNENHHIFISSLTNYEPYAWTTRDGSLQNGFETKTIPATIKNHMDKEKFNYGRGFDILKNLEYKSSDTETCGLHIHVSSKYFIDGIKDSRISHQHVLLLSQMLMTSILEVNWQSILKFTRRSNDTLDRWASNRGFIGRYVDVSQYEQFNEHRFRVINEEYNRSGYKRDKYCTINNGHGNTFEFRIFKGTLNEVANYASIQLVYNISKIVKDLITKYFNSSVTSLSTVDYPSLGKDIAKILNMSLEDVVNYVNWDELTEYYNNIELYLKD
jgi:hypothetical protein